MLHMAWRLLFAATPASFVLGSAWTRFPPQHSPNDQAYLVAAKITPDANGLIAFFRSRSLRGEQLGRLERLLDDLGDNHFKVRESASKALVEVGIPALPSLRRAIGDSDPERSRRAEACRSAKIERASSAGNVRWLARAGANPGATEAPARSKYC